MRDPVAAIEAFLLHPFATLAVGLVLLVIGWRMDSSASSYFLFTAWILFSLSAFRALSAQPLVLRFLWTMLIGSLFGLFLYYLEARTAKRTATPASVLAQTPQVLPSASPPVIHTTDISPARETKRPDDTGIRASASEAAQKARRHRLRKELTHYLVQGAMERDLFRILLQPHVEEGTRKPVDNTEKIGDAILRIQAWDFELVSYVRCRLGEDRALWLMNRSPSSYYPSGIGDVPGLSHSWDVVTSDLAKIEELLRELPALPGGAEARFEYQPSAVSRNLFTWRSEPGAARDDSGWYRGRVIIEATRDLQEPMFSIAFNEMASVTLEEDAGSRLVITKPIRQDHRWFFDVLHPMPKGGRIAIAIASAEPVQIADVQIAFW